MGNSNIQRLGETLSNRMKQTSDAAVPTTIELATVQADLSLKPDSLQAEIPQGDYMVNLMLTGSRYTSTESHTHSGGAHSQYSGSGTHTHNDGEHSHELPAGFRCLRAGDRVLIAWCGDEPVVVAIVVSS